jgi:DNA-binding GntR family transcriptional regulator
MKRGETKNNAVPLSEIAYRQIKSQVVSLVLEPGAQIDETATADALGIGRTPIRESLFRLAAEGLLRGRAGRGFFVRDITLDDIKDLFETLMIMERAAVVLAARRIGGSGIGRLERLNDQFRTAWQGRQFLDLTLANSRFHRELYAATGNDFMTSYLNSLQTQSQRLAYICFTRPAMVNLDTHAEESIRDHHELIARLKQKDEPGAVALITGHIQRFRKQVADYTTPALLELDIVG